MTVGRRVGDAVNAELNPRLCVRGLPRVAVVWECARIPAEAAEGGLIVAAGDATVDASVRLGCDCCCELRGPCIP